MTNTGNITGVVKKFADKFLRMGRNPVEAGEILVTEEYQKEYIIKNA